MWIIKFLKHLVKINPSKSIFTVLTLLLLIVTLSLNANNPVTKKIVYYYKNGNDNIYLTNTSGAYGVIIREKEIPIINNTITYDETNGLYFLSILFMVTFFVPILIATIIGGPAGWQIKDCRVEADIDNIECEEKDGVINVIFKNRLIKK